MEKLNKFRLSLLVKQRDLYSWIKYVVHSFVWKITFISLLICAPKTIVGENINNLFRFGVNGSHILWRLSFFVIIERFIFELIIPFC